MSQIDLNKKIQIMFFENAEANQIPPIIAEQFASGDLKSVNNMLECIYLANLKPVQMEAVVEALETEFLKREYLFLCKHLFMLYDKLGNENMARFYLDNCIEEIEHDENYEKVLRKYALEEVGYLPAPYFKNNFSRSYTFNGEDKSYSVHSKSLTIGQNMTLLKTPYGSIIFDCGAKCQRNSAQIITNNELIDFLQDTDTEVEDIKAVIISHAHMDHYGSLSTLLEIGIDNSRIFTGQTTRELIDFAAKDMQIINNTMPISAFFVAKNKLKISAFPNGHIIGSEGFIVTFDNINVVYTGDYCLHNQKTVKGLNPVDISNHIFVKKEGIDCLITESTYGFKQHYLNHDGAEFVLRHFVDKLYSLNYKVFLPAFAIGRSQELALILNDKYSVLVDGLAVKICQEYERLTGLKIFNSNTRYSTEEEDKLRNFACNNVIIASSGMLAKNSTSSNYVEEFLASGEKIALIITGYMDNEEESYGAELLRQWRAKENIMLDISLSAHASYEEILELIQELQPRNIVSIHGAGIAHREKTDDVPMIEETIDEEPINNEIKYLEVQNGTTKQRISNFVKTGRSIKKNDLALEHSQALQMAFKLMIKAMKADETFNHLEKYLVSLNDVEMVWEYCNNAVLNEFKFPCLWNDEKTDEDDLLFPEEITEDSIIETKEIVRPVVNPKPIRREQSSDIMIVKMTQGDYYVSEKIKGREVYYKLLVDRSRTSNHFVTIEEARIAAERLRQMIIDLCPDCEIVEIDFKDHPKNEKTKITEPFYDNDGVVLGGITVKGGLRLDFLPEEEQYKYIDKKKYQDKLNDLIKTHESKEFNFYDIGKVQGYNFAQNASIPYLRFEIFKAQELIKSFDWDKELFACDIERYSGYIAALNEAISIQKESKAPGTQHWLVHLTDSRVDASKLKYDSTGVLNGIGDYVVQEHPANPDFGKSTGCLEFYIILTDKKHFNDGLYDLLGIDGSQEYSFKQFKSNNKSGKLTTLIETELSNLYILGQGDTDRGIKIKWIDSLSDYVGKDGWQEDDETEQTESSDTQKDLDDIHEAKEIDTIPDDVANLTINQLQFSVRTYNCLNRADIYTLRDLVALSKNDLYKVRNLGSKCVDEIINKLEEYGLSLKEE